MCYAMLEIILNVNKLVQNAGNEQDYSTWGRILDKVDLVSNHCEKHEPNSQCIKVIHEIIDKAEELLDTGQFNGDLDRIYSLINRFSRERPESSVVRLMKYLFDGLRASSNWLANLNNLMGRFFIRNENANIKIEALRLFANTVRYYQINYEKELIKEITQVLRVNLEHDVIVKEYMIKLLIELCTEFSSEHVKEFLVLLKEVLIYPFHVYHQTLNIPEDHYAPIKTAVKGFIQLFKTFLFRLPSDDATDILSVLVNYLNKHYSQPEILNTVIEVRCMILEFILQLRIDNEYRLGLLGHSEDGLNFSPFLLVSKYKTGRHDYPQSSSSNSNNTTAAKFSTVNSSDNDNPPPIVVYVNYVSLSEACGVIVTALKKELEWKVLSLIFEHIPESLKNKAAIVSGENDAEQLALTLCAMISDKSLGLPAALRNTPKKFTGSEFHAFLFPIICSFVSFHTYLAPVMEQKLIKCLEVGLVSWCAPECVSSLTVCILEMRATMVKLLSEVLLNLSKISATVHIAIPILEFLSTLAMFPTVFVNFIPEQYMSIFAISLPYTNPLKYNYYIVCLAHHVISIWFLRCNKLLRRDFVKYIISGLKSNALAPFIEREPSIKSQSLLLSSLSNEDSTDRKRSTSLIEKRTNTTSTGSSTNNNKEKHGSCQLDICRGPLEKSSIYDSLMSFHRELVETCVDLMSRYMFSSCQARPKRHDSSALLFEEGQSMTWLLGSKLITITTSVCTQKPIRGHLCDKCSRICRLFDNDNSNSKRKSSSLAGFLASGSSSGLRYRSRVRDGPFIENLDLRQNVMIMMSDDEDQLRQDQLCSCWCQGWVEIRIRRPTGDTTWTVRLENESNNAFHFEPLMDISTLNLPSTMNKALQKRSSNVDVATDPDDVFLTDVNESSTLKSAAAASSCSVSKIYPPKISDAISRSAATMLASGGNSNSGRRLQSSSVKYRNDANRQTLRTPDNDTERGRTCKNDVNGLSSIGDVDNDLKTSVHTNGYHDKDNDADDTSDLHSRLIHECKSKRLDMKFRDKRLGKHFNNEFRSNLCEAIPEESNTSPCSTNNSSRTVSNGVNSADGDIDNQRKTDENVNSSNSKSSSGDNKTANSSNKLSRSNSSGSGNTIIDRIQHQLHSRNLFSNDSRITAKPPRSPSPIMSTSTRSRNVNKDIFNIDDSFESAYQRPRLHTISVSNPVDNSHNDDSEYCDEFLTRKEIALRNSKISSNPRFVFLQLFHSAHFGVSHDTPMLLPSTPVFRRALNVFDMIPPYETHKIGVIYVGPGQNNNEIEILKNQYGSVRYIYFIQKLGTLRRLADADPQTTFLGGLAKDGSDGNFAYIWEDDIMQVVFHVASLMPTKDNDESCNNKKRHIGNDYVTIVYNESGTDYDLNTVKCQYNFACVIVEPLDMESNKVTVKARKDLEPYVGRIEPKIVSDENVSLLARQLALHMNLASSVFCSLSNERNGTYASNWLERLRKIKHIRNLILKQGAVENSNATNTSHHTVNPFANRLNSSTNADNRNTGGRIHPRKIHPYDFTEYT